LKLGHAIDYSGGSNCAQIEAPTRTRQNGTYFFDDPPCDKIMRKARKARRTDIGFACCSDAAFPRFLAGLRSDGAQNAFLNPQKISCAQKSKTR
jgi:hypothetical protein